MKKSKILAVLGAAVMSLTALGGCGKSDKQQSGETKEGEHEPITMMTTSAIDHVTFSQELKKVCPEVNIEFVSYKGHNTTQYNNVQLETGDICDIFTISALPYEDLQKEHLMDLSGESFISNYNLSMISEVAIDGGVYMLPTNVSFYGIYYNKTLFEKHGWEAPKSFEELEALAPKIEEAGVKLAECSTQFPGANFSYFFDLAATDFITSLDGIKWMEDFTAGNAQAEGNLDSSADYFKKWIDLGMLSIGETPDSDSDTFERFKEGNTAFLMTNANYGYTQNDDGSGDEYGLLPYLSEDGSNNIIVTKVNCYFGLNSELENNTQKKEDALKVMSFISSAEGQHALSSKNNVYAPLKTTVLDESSPLYEATKLVDAGKSMTLIYTGWEKYIVGIGDNAYETMGGKISEKDFLEEIDKLQADVIKQGGAVDLAQVEENLTKEQAAQLVGTAFAKASEADCALISIGDYHGGKKENSSGINAKIYAGIALDENVVCTFNPLGWSNTIKKMTLTGAQIKAFTEEGYYVDDDDKPFEYLLITKDGAVIEDDKTYTVACTGESDERAEKGKMEDTGLVGQDVLEEYISSLGVLNSETILWTE